MNKILVIFLTMLILIAVSSASIDVKTLNTKIASEGLAWSAKETKFSSLSLDAKKLMLGLGNAPIVNLSTIKSSSASYVYPSKYDLRNVNGSNFCTGIRDQSGCGSCVAFATVATVESSYEVYTKNPSANLDLSEWDLFTRGGSCGAGWLFVPALTALQRYGLCTESCYPYLTDELRCAGYSSQLVKIASWKQLKSLDEIKWWIANKGPVITGMEVYDDFFYYDSGIYSAAYGGFVGNHAVSVVGFSDEGSYWICKNSWGTSWGESGWVRISYTADTAFGSFGFYGVEFAASPTPPNAPDKPSGSAICVVGTSYSYSTSATDPNGDQVKYTFDWGDGTTSTTDLVNSGTSASASHSWSTGRTYQVKAMATNSKGATSGWSNPLAVSVTDPNGPPTAPSTPSGPISGNTGTSYSYTTMATDPNGDLVKYTFNWGDGTTSTTDLVNSGTSASASHSWSTARTYLVKAMATNSKSGTSGWSNPQAVTITHQNRAPTVPSIPSGPISGNTGTSYSYTTMATDPDGDQVKYTFDWGDGTKSTTNLVNSGKSASTYHKWTTLGTYQVKAMATDSKGAFSGWSSPMTFTIVGNSPPNTPSIPTGPISGKVNTFYSYSTSATDPDGNQVKYTFDWGDGTKSVTNVVNSGKSASAYHKWTTFGTYQVKAMATDSKGAFSGWSSPMTFTIAANRPPNTPSIPTGPISGKVKTFYSYSTSATDPDGDQVKYTFDWGDGTKSVTSVVNSGKSASAYHKWTTFGTYQVKAMATDSKGAFSGWSSPMTFTIAANSLLSTPSYLQITHLARFEALKQAKDNKVKTTKMAGLVATG